MLTPSEKILQKALVSSRRLDKPPKDENDRGLDSRGWNSIQAGLRDRAFFMSQVTEPHILDAARRLSAQYADGHVDISKLRIEWRNYLEHTGYQPPSDVAGTIKDLYTQARIDVVLKTNVAQARGFVQFAEGMTPGAFAAFPAQEFTRVVYRKQKRADWPRRWAAAGGKVYGGRMIALKNDSVWGRLGAAGPFGNPFPPFDWGSGMGVVDVDRREAIELGLVSKEQIDEHVEKLRERQKDGNLPSMNGHLAAQIPYKPNSTEWRDLKGKFGDFVKFEGDEIVWREDWTEDFLRNADKKGFSFNAGLPTQQLLDVVRRDCEESLAARIKGSPLVCNDSWLNDEDDKVKREPGHGRKHFYDRETEPGNLPMTKSDLELLPSLWRSPTRADMSEAEDSTLFLEIDTLDGCVIQARIGLSHNPRLKTIFKRQTSEIEENRDRRRSDREARRIKQRGGRK